MNRQGELSLAELYNIIRSQIEHEGDLISQRVIWQILTQAFFFGAYATLLNAPDEAKNTFFEVEQILLVWLLPTAALLAGLITYFSIAASLKTLVYLRELYEEHVDAKAPFDSSSKLYPDIQGPPHLRKWAILSPAVMPLIFSITWMIILGRLVMRWVVV